MIIATKDFLINTSDTPVYILMDQLDKAVLLDIIGNNASSGIITRQTVSDEEMQRFMLKVNPLLENEINRLKSHVDDVDHEEKPSSTGDAT